MKRFISLLISLLIMGVIFMRIDLSKFASHMTGMNGWLFVFGTLFFIPQVLLSAYRWREMIRERVSIGLWESVQLILSGNALNILLPSRVGDLSKAYFMKKEGRMDLSRGMNIVIFEKYIDLAALAVVVLVGIFCAARWDSSSFFGISFAAPMIGVFPILYFFNIERWVSAPFFERYRVLAKIKHFLLDTQQYLFEVKNNPRKLVFLVVLSVFLWFLHIVQFYVIFKALHSPIGIFQVFRLVPLAILVGLLPITVAGVGTRDSAMIYFFSPFDQASRIAGVGLFASLRYFVPGIAGLLFLSRYLVAPDTSGK